MNIITVSEALKLASGRPGVPQTIRGLTVVGLRYDFIYSKQIKENICYDKLYCNKEKLKKFINFVKVHYTTAQIAEAVQRTPGGIYLKLIQLHIKEIKQYGKTYYTKKDRKKIIDYYKKNKG